MFSSLIYEALILFWFLGFVSPNHQRFLLSHSIVIGFLRCFPQYNPRSFTRDQDRFLWHFDRFVANVLLIWWMSLCPSSFLILPSSVVSSILAWCDIGSWARIQLVAIEDYVFDCMTWRPMGLLEALAFVSVFSRTIWIRYYSNKPTSRSWLCLLPTLPLLLGISDLDWCRKVLRRWVVHSHHTCIYIWFWVLQIDDSRTCERLCVH